MDRSIYQVTVKHHPIFKTLYQIDNEAEMERLQDHVDFLKETWGDAVGLKFLGHPTTFVTKEG